MCLYIGGKQNKFIAKNDIIVYKELTYDFYRKCWKTPYQHLPIEFDKVLIPDSEKEEKEYGYKYIIEEGAIHTRTSIKNRQYLENYNDAFKAIIPKGTEFWLQDDLSEIASKKLIITKNRPIHGEETDLSDYYDFGVDVYLKNRKRVKNSENFNAEDVLGIFGYDNQIISVNYEYFRLIDSDILIFYKKEYEKEYKKEYESAHKDYNGYENTKKLKNLGMPPKILDYYRSLEDWYIPALGEFEKTFCNLIRINLTLKNLGLDIIELNDRFWTSTLHSNKYAWHCNTRGQRDCYTYYLSSGNQFGVLPFLKLS